MHQKNSREKGRPDAIAWLREQERLLKSNPQFTGLAMRPLWQEVVLPFQVSQPTRGPLHCVDQA